jgi:hypothetical protein
MSVSSIVTSIGAPVVIAGAVSALFNYYATRSNLFTQYELEQQRELRALMGQYTGRMLEAAIDWDRRMMQLYKYWDPEGEDKEPDDPKENVQEAGWRQMCPGWGQRLEGKTGPDDLARYRRDPSEYFYLSVVFRFLSLLAIARRFEAEAFYLDARHLKHHSNELRFLCYTKSFLWAMTYSDLSPKDGLPGKDHFNSDKIRPMLDLCYKELGPLEAKAMQGDAEAPHAGSTSPTGQPIFDWARFLVLIQYKSGEPDEFHPDIDQVLEFFDELRPVDYWTDDTGKVFKRRRWERLICLHLLTLNFIATFGFPWQTRSAKKNRDRAIGFLSMDNKVINAFVKGSDEWLGLDKQDHMIELIHALEEARNRTLAISEGELAGFAMGRLLDLGAARPDGEPDPAVLQDKVLNKFRVDIDWLKQVQWVGSSAREPSLSQPAIRLFRAR